MVEPHSPQPSGAFDQQSSRSYSYADILKMTNHFDTLLGEGGFGKVYYGRIGNTEVAVKLLSPKSAQGYREFQAEVCGSNRMIFLEPPSAFLCFFLPPNIMNHSPKCSWQVDILLRVHHRHLTSLVGYCNEGEEKMGLIYEYMGRGNLGSLLLGMVSNLFQSESERVWN